MKSLTDDFKTPLPRPDTSPVVADTWEKLGPAPDVIAISGCAKDLREILATVPEVPPLPGDEL